MPCGSRVLSRLKFDLDLNQLGTRKEDWILVLLTGTVLEHYRLLSPFDITSSRAECDGMLCNIVSFSEANRLDCTASTNR